MLIVTPEKWDENIKGSRVRIKQNICMVGQKTNQFDYQSAFGIYVVHSGCYKWKFKINKTRIAYATGHHFRHPTSIWFGIIRYDDHRIAADHELTSTKAGYGWVANENKLVQPDTKSVPPFDTLYRWDKNELIKYGKRIRTGDIVEMIFDFDDAKLRYIVNGIDFGYAKFKTPIDNNIKYRMAVTFYKGPHEVELLDFCAYRQTFGDKARLLLFK